MQIQSKRVFWREGKGRKWNVMVKSVDFGIFYIDVKKFFSPIMYYL